MNMKYKGEMILKDKLQREAKREVIPEEKLKKGKRNKY